MNSYDIMISCTFSLPTHAESAHLADCFCTSVQT